MREMQLGTGRDISESGTVMGVCLGVVCHSILRYVKKKDS